MRDFWMFLAGAAMGVSPLGIVLLMIWLASRPRTYWRPLGRALWELHVADLPDEGGD